MPNWKKVIVSGSDAILNSLYVTASITGSDVTIDDWGSISASLASIEAGAISTNLQDVTDNGSTTTNNINVAGITASSLIYPSTDGLVNQGIITDGAGNLTFGNPQSDNTVITIKNVSGGSIPKGTPLYITASGTSGNLVGVVPADAGNPAVMPAGVIAGEALPSNGDEGIGLINGFINGVDTSAFSSGDEVFVAVGGGYTNVAPTGSALVQKLGNVEKVDGSNGSGVITGPGTARSVPNINPGYTWVGNSDWVATPISTSSLLVTSAVTASFLPSDTNLNITSITASTANFQSASIGYLTTITGSATIVGDAFIILNTADAQRYAGIIVEDSGSAPTNYTASYFYDSQTNDWNYEYSTPGGTDFGVALFGPEYSTKGSPTYLTDNKIPKATDNHHLIDSNISDNGSIISISTPLDITGSITGSDIKIDDWGSVSSSLASISSVPLSTVLSNGNTANNSIYLNGLWNNVLRIGLEGGTVPPAPSQSVGLGLHGSQIYWSGSTPDGGTASTPATNNKAVDQFHYDNNNISVGGKLYVFSGVSIGTGSFHSVHCDYTLFNSNNITNNVSNVRAGSLIVAVDDANRISYTEYSTPMTSGSQDIDTTNLNIEIVGGALQCWISAASSPYSVCKSRITIM